MRMVIVFGLVVAVAGCGDDPGSSDDGSPGGDDMAMQTSDDGAAPPDLLGQPDLATDAGADDMAMPGADLAGTDAAEDGGAMIDAAGGDASGADAAVTDAGPKDGGGPTVSARIEEIYVDRDNSGDEVEFVEIGAAPATPLDEVWLRLLDAKGMVKHEVVVADKGEIMGVSGLWVVGGGGVNAIANPAIVNRSYSVMDWGMDNTAGAVQLIHKGARTVLLDVVGYGALVDPPPSEPKATVEGTPLTLPMAKSESMARLEKGKDTGDNAADFCKMKATPGQRNDLCIM